MDIDRIAQLPGWANARRSETLEEVAFLSGAGLSHLHLLLGQHEVPHALWRDRLALRAAEACVAFAGRPECAMDLRDAVHLLRPGDLPGPAGEICLQWRRAVERPVSVKALHRALPHIEASHIAGWLDAGGHQARPVTRAATLLETFLSQAPHAEVAALILADAALAQALGWAHSLPLFAVGLNRSDLRKRGTELRLACHRAVLNATSESTRMAADLTRRTLHLQAIAPKLRAKAAPAAVSVFMTRDAVTPAALPLPDRAARRLCDRLVNLGAIRELTGRDTFRLYGV